MRSPAGLKGGERRKREGREGSEGKGEGK